MKKTRIIIIFAIVLSLISEAKASDDAVSPCQKAVSAVEVHGIGGFVGLRMRANMDHYLKPFDCQHWVDMQTNRTYRDWFWTGEQPGKWLESSILSGSSLEDQELLNKSRRILAEMIKAQAKDGYLGITADDLCTAKQPLRGMDPYEQYFTLHALITAYEVWGDKEALEAAVKLADYYLDHIAGGKAEFWPSPCRPPENVNTIICSQYTWVPDGTKRAPEMYVRSEIAGHTAHYSWEGTLFIDPVARLYQVTGEKRFLDWCQWVVSRIDVWSGWDSFSKLDQVAAGTLGVHQLQPYVHSHTFQMNFMGFLRLYQATGDKSLLRKVEGAWEDIARRQVYITGGVSVAEHYEPGYNKPITGHVVETCANMSWLQLNQLLLEITGNPRYADAIERLLINHVFAAQTVDGDSNRYHTPPNGFKPSDYFHGADCCSSSGHRQISMLPGLFYATNGDGIVINQYVASAVGVEIDGKRILLKQSTKYPEDESSTITLSSTTPVELSLQLRLPAWCDKPSITINDKPESGLKPGSYHTIRRLWKNGDAVVVQLPMTVSWVEDKYSESQRHAMMRGPVVYTLDTVWWNDKNNVAKPMNAGDEIAVIHSAQPEQILTGDRAMGPFFEIPVQCVDGRKTKAPMVPFCNIGRWYKNQQEKESGVDPEYYSYAVWLYDTSSSEYKENAEAIKKQREKYAGAVDYVLVGDVRSEKEHNLKGQSSSGQFNLRNYRHSNDWFSYDLKVSTEQKTELVAGYWGGESDLREFEVFANDIKIANVKLHNNRPGEYFEEHYAIPFDLIKGKTNAIGQKVDTMTIKFKAKNLAGGVFDLYTKIKANN